MHLECLRVRAIGHWSAVVVLQGICRLCLWRIITVLLGSKNPLLFSSCRMYGEVSWSIALDYNQSDC